MKGLRILWALVLVLALAACTGVFLQQPYQVFLEPQQLGYGVDDQGRIVVVENDAFVQVAPGASGGYLERYEYRVIDNSGNEVFRGSGFVGVEVPPGREESGGRVVYVPKRSQPFRFSLDGTVAAAHLQQGAPLNWRYRVTWYVKTSNGTEVSWMQEYQIKYPLKR